MALRPKVAVWGGVGDKVVSRVREAFVDLGEVDGRLAVSIENKYYSAEVDVVRVTHAHEVSDLQVQAGIIAITPQEIEQSQALLESIAEMESLESKLCVVFGDAPEPFQEKLIRLGIECVLENELERIQEALQVVMWSNMKMAQGVKLPEVCPEAYVEETIGDGGDEDASEAVDEIGQNLNEIAATQQNGMGEDNVEEGLDGMEDLDAIFAQVKAFREQTNALSDEERRDAAASMALRLAAVLGLDDDDNEDE